MSRIGKIPITIPEGVCVQLRDKRISVKGKRGELSQSLPPALTLAQEGDRLVITRVGDSRSARSLHGLYRALVANMVVGVADGFSEELELVGVGYRASNQGQRLDLSLGFSHNIAFQLPEAVTAETRMEKGKNPYIKLTACDKQLLGMVAAKIRSFRKPEPYKGKGVRFVGEQIRIKAGKSA